MVEMPRLVVTMPAYNAESTIKLAVGSTLRAMPRDSELLVLDDKSTDKTLQVLDSVSDPRLRVLAAEQNVGGPASRRRLLSESDSEFVASIDADDVSFPWRFSLQETAIENADAVFSSAIRFGSVSSDRRIGTRLARSMRVRPSAPVSIRPSEFPSAALFHNPVWHPSLFARRCAIEKVGGYNISRHGDDWDLWLRMARSGSRMCRLAVPVIGYRESPKQASRSRGKAAAIQKNRALRASYVDLFNSLARSVSLDIDQPLSEVAEIARTGLGEQLVRFRTMNRLHYGSVLLQNRIHFVLSLFPDESSAG